jgi:hypothetical protein
MQKDLHITEVIFRVNKDNEVYALFPHEVCDFNGHVSSYQHIGQHSSADYKYCLKTSKNATTPQALPLYNELTNLGYNLLVIKRQNYNSYLKSYNEIRK